MFLGFFLMGNRGPQKTPTATLKLHGSRKVEGRKNEPMTKVSGPSCPHWLTGEARKIWHKIVPALKKMGVLGSVDGFALARYCLYAVLWLQELNKSVGRSELTMNRYANQLNRLEQSFGLTPSSRAGLSTGQTVEKDPLEELMTRMNRRNG